MAQSFTWSSLFSGSWDDAANWTGGTGVPGSTDVATINTDPVLFGTMAAATLNLNGFPELDGDGTFGSIVSPTYDGFLIPAGISIVAGTVYSAPTVAGPGAALIVTQAFTIDSSSAGLFDGASLTAPTLDVGVQFSNVDSIIFAGASSLEMDPNATAEIGGAGTASPGTLTIDNGASVIIGALYAFEPLSNDGTIAIEPRGFLQVSEAVVGTGAIVLQGSSSTAQFLGSIGGGETVDFTTPEKQTLDLDGTIGNQDPTIAGFEPGDFLEMGTLDPEITGASYSPTGANIGILSVMSGSTVVAAPTLIGNYTGDVFFPIPGQIVGSLDAQIVLAPNGLQAPTPAPAGSNSDEYSWNATTGGDWSDASNWTDVTTSAPATTAPGFANYVTLTNTGTLDQIVNGDGDAGALILNGPLALNGTFTVGNPPTVTGGLEVENQVELLPGASIDATSTAGIDSLAALSLDDASMTVNGTFDIGANETISGTVYPFGGTLFVFNGGFLQAGGLDLLQGDVRIDAASTMEVGTAGGAAAGALTVDPGVAVTANSATIVAATINNGTIDVIGTLASNAALDNTTTFQGPITGIGTLEIEAAATVGAVAASQTVELDAPGDILNIGDPATFQGSILELDAGDTIEVPSSIVATSFSGTSDSGVLSLLNAGGAVQGTIAIGFLPSGTNFAVFTGGASGGTTIVPIVGTLQAGSPGSPPPGTSDGESFVFSALGGDWADPTNWFDETDFSPAIVAPGSLDSVALGSGSGLPIAISGAGDAMQATVTNDAVLSGSFGLGSLAVNGSWLEVGPASTLLSTDVSLSGGALHAVGPDTSVTVNGALTFAPGIGDGVTAQNGATVTAAGLAFESSGSNIAGNIAVDATSSVEFGTAGGAAAGSVTVDNGTSLVVSTGQQINFKAPVVNNGLIQVSGGLVDFANLSGTGTLGLGSDASAGGFVEVNGTIASGQTIAFAGTSGILDLASTSIGTPTLTGLTPGDSIELDGTFSRAIYTATGSGVGTVTVDDGPSTPSLSFVVLGSYQPFQFVASPGSGLSFLGLASAASAALPAAVPALTASGGTLTASGANSFVLNLGTVQAGGTLSSTLTVSNAAAPPADALSGSFTLPLAAGFVESFASFTSLAAGASLVAGTIAANGDPVGFYSQIATLAPVDNGASGPNALTAQTVTIEATVTAAPVPPAIEALTTPGTISFGNVRVGGTDNSTVGITNAATAPAGTLSVVGSAAGDTFSIGTVAALSPGGLDTTDIVVGVNTGTVGVQSGVVTLAGTSTANGTATTLASPPTVSLSGTVFREAAGTVAPITLGTIHVGDAGTVSLNAVATNIAANDGFSEALIATIASASGSITSGGSPGGASGDIAAGGTGTATASGVAATGTAGIETGTVTVALISDGGTGLGSIDGLGTTVIGTVSVPVTVTVDNYAHPVFEDVSSAGTFTPGATAYTLNLGTIAQGTGPFTVNLGVANNTTGPSDVLTGSLSAIGSSAFTNSGLTLVGTLAAGQSDVAPEITLATGTTGTFSEAITLTGTGSNPGFSAALPAETLTVTGTVVAPLIPPAIADILNGGSVGFGNVHAGAAASENLDISNAATGTAAALDASVQSVSGAATANGSFIGLAPGAENTTSITAGINTSTAGVQTGTVAMAFVSDGGTLGSAALPAQDVTVSGTVYREAAATLLPLNASVHVGASGTISLPISNSDAADGFSENLIASLIGVTGSLGIAGSGPTADITAGDTNTNTLALSFATTQAGTVSGSATVGLVSDGGGIDGLGQTTLTAQVVPVSVTIDNYASAALASTSSLLTETGADAYVLNFGTVTQDASVAAVTLSELNAAAAPADGMDGVWSVHGATGFTNTGFASFSTIGADGSLTAGTISLGTSNAGTLTETLTLMPTDDNGAGFTLAQAPVTLTVEAVIAPATAIGDVHMTTFDGLRYDFQAVGDFTLARSTNAGDPFDVQIETAAFAPGNDVSVTTEVAAQIGGGDIVFALDGGIEVNGARSALSVGETQQLMDGSVTRDSGSVYAIDWSGGEALTVTNDGYCFNLAMTLGAGDGPGSVAGLLGSGSGQANDFALPDGTVLRQPLSAATILGTFANAWSVAADASMLNGTIIAPLGVADLAQPAFITATTPGEILTGSLGAASSGASYAGTMADLGGDTLFGFASGDAVDITDFAPAGATLNFAGSDGDGVLTLTGAGGTTSLRVEGAANNVGFSLTADGHGGSRIQAT